MKFAANLISYVLHPLLMTTYLVLILTFSFPSMLMIRPEKNYLIVGLIFVFTFILPAMNVLVLRYFGNITSLSLFERKERVAPFIFITILYILVTLLFYYKLSFNQNFNKLMMIVTAMIVISMIVTLFYKISIHSLAITGLIGILLPLNKITEDNRLLLPTVLTICAAGLVMAARLKLGAHTPREVMHGSLIGFMVGFCGMILLF